MLTPVMKSFYKEFWVGQREQVFKAGAPTFIKAYSQQYLSLQPQFAEVYQKVMAHRETLERYGKEAGSAALPELTAI